MVQLQWQTRRLWEGLTPAVPRRTVYRQAAAGAPSHPALSRTHCILWKTFLTRRPPTPLPPATARRTWQRLEIWLWWRWHLSPQRRLAVERCLSVTQHPGLKMMELAPGCPMRPGGLFKAHTCQNRSILHGLWTVRLWLRSLWDNKEMIAMNIT